MNLRDGSTAAFRVIHLDNLAVYLARNALHAPTHTPDDGLQWRSTHAAAVQARRATQTVPRGPGGVLLDYVPFHFGPRNLFLYNLHTGRVEGYDEGQEPLVTLVISVQRVAAAGHGFVFYDGHALDGLSECFDHLDDLANLDWPSIDGRAFDNRDPARKRHKQAEFMVHRMLPLELVVGIAVCNDAARRRVTELQDHYPSERHLPVAVRPLYYF